MKRRSVLRGYQWLTALSDGGTGLALVAAPALTLAAMGIAVPGEVLPYVRYLGAFVLSTGMACAYGGWRMDRTGGASALRAVWVLTAITRALVAVCVGAQVMGHALDPHWGTVAVFDGALAVLQGFGLVKEWPERACLR